MMLFLAICKNTIDPEALTSEKEMRYDNNITAPFIPQEVSFAGEMLPMNCYWVKEGLDRELIIHYYQHARTLQIFKRSGRFFPIIEKILKEEGVPEDIKYLCVAESSLENVISPAKATGYWQFMDATARAYGLEINENVDERYHLEKSTVAACKYLKKLKQQFGSWSLAAAAYNMGEGGLSKAIEAQQCDNYWDLFLNSETSRYVYRIVAYKLLFENQQTYGINLSSEDYYYPIPYKELKITSSISDLPAFAKSHGVIYRELKELNPWLRSNKLNVGSKEYIIKIPEKLGKN